MKRQLKLKPVSLVICGLLMPTSSAFSASTYNYLPDDKLSVSYTSTKSIGTTVTLSPTLVNEDPFNVIYSAYIKDGKPYNITEKAIPKEAFSRMAFVPKKYEKPVESKPPEKIHPLLQEWIATRPGYELRIVIINFRDDLIIPRFPIPRIDQARDSAENKRLLTQAQQIVEGIKQKRAEEYKRLIDELHGRYGLRVEGTYWLIKAMAVEIPLAAVKEMEGFWGHNT